MEWNKDMDAAPLGVELLVKCVFHVASDETDTVRWVDFRDPDGKWVLWPSMVWVPVAPTAWMHIPE